MKIQPQHDPDLERRYIRSLIGGRHGKVKARAVSEFAVPRHVFAQDAHAELYDAIVSVAAKSRSVEDSALLAHLEDAHLFDRVGGRASVLDLLDLPFEPTSPYMVSRLVRLHRIRGASDAVRSAQSLLAQGDLDAAMQVIANAVQAAEVDHVSESHGETTFADAFGTAFREFTEGGTKSRVTSIPLLSSVLAGAVSGSLTTIGGTTGAGKSSLALMIAIAMRRAGMRPGVISLEDPEKVWGDRVGAHYTDVSLLALERDGKKLSLNDGDRIRDAIDVIRENDTPLVTLDNPDIEAVKTKMRRLVHVHGCDVLFVDYLQLITRNDMPGASHAQKVSRNAQDMKNLAKRLGVPLWLLSQLARPEKGKAAEPSIFSLKETGDLENMSEAVVLLWKTGDQTKSEALGKVAKMKSSPERPRFVIRRNDAGAIESLAPHVDEFDGATTPERGGSWANGSWRD